MRSKLSTYLSVAVAAVLVTGGVVLATPGAAVADSYTVNWQSACGGFWPDTSEPYNAPVNVTFRYGGVNRARYLGNFWFDNYYSASTGKPYASDLELQISVDDLYADGYPPYFYLKARFTNGTTGKTPWYHDTMGASNPNAYCWWTQTEWDARVISSVEMWVSLDYISSVPEYKVLTWSMPRYCVCPV